MKKILFILTLCVVMASCNTNDVSYSYAEVMALIATEAATPTDTGLEVKGLILQIVVIKSVAYYPAETINGTIRYYPAEVRND